MQGDERRRARGVDGHHGAFEAQRVGDPARDDAGQAAVAEIAGAVLGDSVAQPGGPVVVHHAREHTGAAAAQRQRIDPGSLQRFPGGLQQQPLLGVHGRGLAGADLEEVGVELRGVVEESALARVALAGGAGLGVVDAPGVPAAVVREGGDGVGARVHEPPQVLRGGDAAGEPTAHADDRDRLVHGGRAVGPGGRG